DVFIIANRNVPESKDVADHYVAKRGVPKDHVIMLDLPKVEDISREAYDANMVAPLREALKDRKAEAKVLLTVYGVPLRVGGMTQTPEEKAQSDKLQREREAARKKVIDLEKDKAPEKDIADAKQKRDDLDKQYRALGHPESRASVDSELMLLWWPKYP